MIAAGGDPARAMRSRATPDAAGRLILVIAGEGTHADNLKELIEFMDAPSVQASTPRSWRASIGERRLAAVFFDKDVPPDDLHAVIEEIGRSDPNVPIVIVHADRSDA